MLMFKERCPAIRTLRGWAISVLHETGAIRECEEHGWERSGTRSSRDCVMIFDRARRLIRPMRAWPPAQPGHAVTARPDAAPP
ncbi:hypothetical protein [Bradyrhizobium sp. 15]|uniref:hypothetical protein n=1 Tax=Bradyrhizobium sp. 15 TaxID=2782633 RepID=UPI001FF73027|nr:hypothetical protein [Bradyrhizobium sp. 15]MCK1439743.1 hypothetical protein [Bradyrhizobium sp. 15]